MVLAALRSADSKGVYMAHAARREQDEGAGRVINSVAKSEKRAIEAVRDFVETVNRALPDIGEDGGPRQQIIDSAFKMTEQLVGASNELAHRVVKVGQVAAQRVPGQKSAARRAAARKKTAAPKAAAKKAPAPKAAAKKTAAPKTPSSEVLSPVAHPVADSEAHQAGARPDPTYHSDSVEYPPEHRNVHHNNNNCPNGKQIKPEHREAGTGGKPLCRRC